MSRAFVSEDAAEARDALLPERPVSSAQNLVTQQGLDQIDAELARLQHAHATTLPDDPTRAAIDRDLRYWRSRRLSASLVPAIKFTPEEVVFGCSVTLAHSGAGPVTYTIVGEDEANPTLGLLSWASPLAAALMGARVGEVVEVGGGRPAVTVQSISGR